MKTAQEFKDFYFNTLINDVEKVESKRKSAILFSIIISIIGLLFFIFIFYISTLGEPDFKLSDIPLESLPILLLYLSIYVGSVVAASSKLSTELYQNAFKLRIIRQILNFICPDLKYEFYTNIDESKFCDSNLFANGYVEITGKDHVWGQVEQTNIDFSFVQSTSNFNILNRSKEFIGFFFVADFNKIFSGQTYVLPDILEDLLGHIGKGIQSLDTIRGELVNLEDPKFEKLYKVYSDNQITARYILTTSLMKRIITLTSQFNCEIYISFINSKMYLAIPTLYNVLDAQYFSPINDFGTIFEYFNYLQLIIGIVDELNLNNDVWK